jgi:hypothetical protein
MKISKKAIIVILLIIIIGIIIGTYFLFFYKNSASNKFASNQVVRPIITNGPNTVGFCHSTTFNGVDQPQVFRSVDEMSMTLVFDVADNGELARDVQYKWAYDPTNSLNLSRQITNASNAYSLSELSALGKTSTPGTYLVNKVITIYDKNDPKYKKGQLELNPYIMTTMANCK